MTTKSTLDLLQRSQNKIVRLLFGEYIAQNHTSYIYDSLELFKISEHYEMELGKLIFYTLNTDKYSKTVKDDLCRLPWIYNFNRYKKYKCLPPAFC